MCLRVTGRILRAACWLLEGVEDIVGVDLRECEVGGC